MSWLECHRISLTAVGSYRSYCFALGLFERVRLDALLLKVLLIPEIFLILKIPDSNLTVEKTKMISLSVTKRSGEDSNLLSE